MCISINKIIYPTIKLIANNNETINKLFLKFSFFLNKYISPKPALQINPEIVAPKLRAFETKSSVIIIDDAHVGINPTILERRGVK